MTLKHIALAAIAAATLFTVGCAGAPGPEVGELQSAVGLARAPGLCQCHRLSDFDKTGHIPDPKCTKPALELDGVSPAECAELQDQGEWVCFFNDGSVNEL